MSPRIDHRVSDLIEIYDLISCEEVLISPEGIIVSEDESEICISKHLVNNIMGEAVQVMVFEDFALEMIQKGSSPFDLYPHAGPDNEEKLPVWSKGRDHNAHR